MHYKGLQGNQELHPHMSAELLTQSDSLEACLMQTVPFSLCFSASIPSGPHGPPEHAGSSWAYASPSFGSSLRPEHLKHMRELADLPHTPKHVTEVRSCRVVSSGGKLKLVADQPPYTCLHFVTVSVTASHCTVSTSNISRMKWNLLLPSGIRALRQDLRA
eukprot:1146482-Pelagomonas_calceolata.AAC.4